MNHTLRLVSVVLCLAVFAPGLALADDDHGWVPLSDQAAQSEAELDQLYRQAVAEGKAVYYPPAYVETPAQAWPPPSESVLPTHRPYTLPRYGLPMADPLISRRTSGPGSAPAPPPAPQRPRYVAPEYTLRFWSLFAAHKYDHAPSTNAVGYLVEGGLEFGLPTFGRPGPSLAMTAAIAGGWQGYHENGPDQDTGHISASFLLAYQYSWHNNDAFQIGGFFRFDFALNSLKFSDGSPAIGNDGVVGTMAGGFFRYVFRAGGFIMPAGVFFGTDLSSGARDFMVGVDLGGLIGLIVAAFMAALDDWHWHRGSGIVIDVH